MHFPHCREMPPSLMQMRRRGQLILKKRRRLENYVPQVLFFNYYFTTLEKTLWRSKKIHFTSVGPTLKNQFNQWTVDVIYNMSGAGLALYFFLFSWNGLLCYRVEDVLSDDVCKWACGLSWKFASTDHYAHSCNSYAHTKELSWHRLHLQFRGIKAWQWDFHWSNYLRSEIIGKWLYWVRRSASHSHSFCMISSTDGENLKTFLNIYNFFFRPAHANHPATHVVQAVTGAAGGQAGMAWVGHQV